MPCFPVVFSKEMKGSNCLVIEHDVLPFPCRLMHVTITVFMSFHSSVSCKPIQSAIQPRITQNTSIFIVKHLNYHSSRYTTNQTRRITQSKTHIIAVQYQIKQRTIFDPVPRSYIWMQGLPGLQLLPVQPLFSILISPQYSPPHNYTQVEQYPLISLYWYRLKQTFSVYYTVHDLLDFKKWNDNNPLTTSDRLWTTFVLYWRV